MQIKRAVPKKLAPLAHPLKALYKKLLHSPETDLPAAIPAEWIWLKGDLHHWIPVLNRFDTLLQQIAQEYVYPNDSSATTATLTTASVSATSAEKSRDASSKQEPPPQQQQIQEQKQKQTQASPIIPSQPLAPARRALLQAILRMTRLLLENCTNRSLYNSYEVSTSLFRIQKNKDMS